jgi:hypothetical protein
MAYFISTKNLRAAIASSSCSYDAKHASRKMRSLSNIAVQRGKTELFPYVSLRLKVRTVALIDLCSSIGWKRSVVGDCISIHERIV